MVREASARLVLEHMWNAPPVTGSDLMAATGLTRATVHDVCQELIDRGWVRELANQREHGDYRKGRPARRYAFDPLAGLVVGVDAGEHRVDAIVTDLHGTELGRYHSPPRSGFADATERIAAVGEAITTALAAADATRPVLAVTCRPGTGGGPSSTTTRTSPRSPRAGGATAGGCATSSPCWPVNGSAPASSRTGG
jgi:hypothetical protein